MSLQKPLGECLTFEEHISELQGIRDSVWSWQEYWSTFHDEDPMERCHVIAWHIDLSYNKLRAKLNLDQLGMLVPLDIEKLNSKNTFYLDDFTKNGAGKMAIILELLEFIADHHLTCRLTNNHNRLILVMIDDDQELLIRLKFPQIFDGSWNDM